MTTFDRMKDAIVNGTFGGDWFIMRELAARFGVRKSWYFRNLVFRLVTEGYLEFEISLIQGREGYAFRTTPAYPQTMTLFRMEGS